MHRYRHASDSDRGGQQEDDLKSDDLRHQNVRLAQEVELLKQRLRVGSSRAPSASNRTAAPSRELSAETGVLTAMRTSPSPAAPRADNAPNYRNTDKFTSRGETSRRGPSNADAHVYTPHYSVSEGSATNMSMLLSRSSAAAQEEEGGNEATRQVVSHSSSSQQANSHSSQILAAAALAIAESQRKVSSPSKRRQEVDYSRTHHQEKSDTGNDFRHISSPIDHNTAPPPPSSSNASTTSAVAVASYSLVTSEALLNATAVASMEGQVARYKSRLVSLEREVEEKNRLLLIVEKQARDQNDSNALRMRQLEKTINEAKLSAEGDHGHLMSKLKAAEQSLSTLQEHNTKLEKEKKRLQADLSALQSQVGTSKGKELEAEAALADYSAEREGMQKRIAVLTTENTAIAQLRRENDQLRGLRDDCASLKHSLEDAERELASERTKRRDAERLVFGLEQRAAEGETRRKQLEADVRALSILQSEKAVLEREIESLRSTNALLKSEAESFRKEAEECRRAAEEALRERDKIVETVQGQLLRLRQDIQHAYLDAEESARRATLLQERADLLLEDDGDDGANVEGGGGLGGSSLSSSGSMQPPRPSSTATRTSSSYTPPAPSKKYNESAATLDSATITRTFLARLDETLKKERGSGSGSELAEGGKSRPVVGRDNHLQSSSSSSYGGASYPSGLNVSRLAFSSSNSDNNAHMKQQSRVTSPLRKGGEHNNNNNDNRQIHTYYTPPPSSQHPSASATAVGYLSRPEAAPPIINLTMAEGALRPLYAGLRSLAADILSSLYQEKVVRGKRLADEAKNSKSTNAALQEVVRKLTTELNHHIAKASEARVEIETLQRAAQKNKDDNRFLRELTFSKMKFIFENWNKLLSPMSSQNKNYNNSTTEEKKQAMPRWVEIIEMTAEQTLPGSNMSEGKEEQQSTKDEGRAYSSAALIQLLGEEGLTAHLKTAAAANKAALTASAFARSAHQNGRDEATSVNQLHLNIPSVVAFTDKTWRYLWDHLTDQLVEMSEKASACEAQNDTLQDSIRDLSVKMAEQRLVAEEAARVAETAHLRHVANLHAEHEEEIKKLQRLLAKTRETARSNEDAVKELAETSASLKATREKYSALRDELDGHKRGEAKRKEQMGELRRKLGETASTANLHFEDNAALCHEIESQQEQLAEAASRSQCLADGITAFVRVLFAAFSRVSILIFERNSAYRRSLALEESLEALQSRIYKTVSAASGTSVQFSSGNGLALEDYGESHNTKNRGEDETMLPIQPHIRYRSVSSIRAPAIAILALRRLSVLSQERRRRGVSLLPIHNSNNSQSIRTRQRWDDRSDTVDSGDVYDEDDDDFPITYTRGEAKQRTRHQIPKERSSPSSSSTSMGRLRRAVAQSVETLFSASNPFLGYNDGLRPPLAPLLSLVPDLFCSIPHAALVSAREHQAVGTYVCEIIRHAINDDLGSDSDNRGIPDLKGRNARNSLFEIDLDPRTSLLLVVARASGKWLHRRRQPPASSSTSVLVYRLKRNGNGCPAKHDDSDNGNKLSTNSSTTIGGFDWKNTSRRGETSAREGIPNYAASHRLLAILDSALSSRRTEFTKLRLRFNEMRVELGMVAETLVRQTELKNAAEAECTEIKGKVDNGTWVERALMETLQVAHERIKARLGLEEATRKQGEANLHALVSREVALLEQQTEMLHKMRSLALALATEINTKKALMSVNDSPSSAAVSSLSLQVSKDSSSVLGDDGKMVSAAALLGDRFASLIIPRPIGPQMINATPTTSSSALSQSKQVDSIVKPRRAREQEEREFEEKLLSASSLLPKSENSASTAGTNRGARKGGPPLGDPIAVSSSPSRIPTTVSMKTPMSTLGPILGQIPPLAPQARASGRAIDTSSSREQHYETATRAPYEPRSAERAHHNAAEDDSVLSEVSEATTQTSTATVTPTPSAESSPAGRENKTGPEEVAPSRAETETLRKLVHSDEQSGKGGAFLERDDAQHSYIYASRVQENDRNEKDGKDLHSTTTRMVSSARHSLDDIGDPDEIESVSPALARFLRQQKDNRANASEGGGEGGGRATVSSYGEPNVSVLSKRAGGPDVLEGVNGRPYADIDDEIIRASSLVRSSSSNNGDYYHPRVGGEVHVAPSTASSSLVMPNVSRVEAEYGAWDEREGRSDRSRWGTMGVGDFEDGDVEEEQLIRKYAASLGDLLKRSSTPATATSPSRKGEAPNTSGVDLGSSKAVGSSIGFNSTRGLAEASLATTGADVDRDALFDLIGAIDGRLKNALTERKR